MRADIVRKFADLFSVKRGAALTDSPANNEGKSGMLDIITGIDPDQYKPVSDGGFTKRLRWKIQAGDTAPERLTITPDMASAMLEWNDRNRPVSRKTVERYAALMTAGRWRFTGETIIFSASRLIDGQHRLAACVKAGFSFQALVVYGAPDESFAFIDVGKARGAGDIFDIHGVPNAKSCAAALQWIIGYERGLLGTATNAPLPKGIDHDALHQEYLAHPNLQDSTPIGWLFAKGRLAAPGMMTGLHYLCARKSRREADEFFRKVAEGIGFKGKGDPAYRLNKRLIENGMSLEKMHRKQVAALTIKAWNAHRIGRDVGVLKFAPGEPFPKVI